MFRRRTRPEHIAIQRVGRVPAAQETAGVEIEASSLKDEPSEFSLCARDRLRSAQSDAQ